MQALTANGFKVVERRQEGDWLGLHVVRGGQD
jgi:hypothetical protein